MIVKMNKCRKDGKRSKPRLHERIARSLDIPENVFGSVQIEMRGNIYLRVGGCLGIGEYTETRIRLMTKDGDLIISGENLICSAYCRESAVIEGRIINLNFYGGGDENENTKEKEI